MFVSRSLNFTNKFISSGYITVMTLSLNSVRSGKIILGGELNLILSCFKQFNNLTTDKTLKYDGIYIDSFNKTLTRAYTG